MSRVLEAAAPGKVLLCGEYAVLAGAPALVLAVDRFARVRLVPQAAGRGRIEAPDIGVEAAAFRLTARGLEFDDAGAAARLGLTACLLEGLFGRLRACGREIVPPAIAIDTAEMYHSGPGGRVKLGLGSSAAVSAALYRGLCEWAGAGPPDGSPAGALETLLPAYRSALGGGASGADLAASLAGGLITYRLEGKKPSLLPVCADCMGGFEISNLRFFWTGVPAQTTDYVAAFDRWRQARPRAAGAVLSELSGTASAAAGAAEAGDFGALCRALSDYAGRIESLGFEMGAETLTAPHRRIARLARAAGVGYKTLGAGGGDLGMAFGEDHARLDALVGQVEAAGFARLKLRIAETGAAVAAPAKP